MARELFAIASMVVAAAALIGLFDFIEKNLGEALAPDEAKPIAKTLQAEGGDRQQDRRRASNAHEQETGTSTSSHLGTAPK